MIQFNLLPDVKLDYLRAKRNRRVVTVLSALVVAGSLLLVGIFYTTVNVVQTRHISNIDSDIATTVSSIQSIEDLDRIITVQNQLTSLDGLHEEKPVLSRIFEYLAVIIPSNVQLNSLGVDINGSAMGINGQTVSITEVNRFVDTLKFTEYIVATDEELEDDDAERGLAFESVVLASFGQNQGEVNFNIEITFNPMIFDSSAEIILEVPDQITTRSELSRPEALFVAPEEDGEGED